MCVSYRDFYLTESDVAKAKARKNWLNFVQRYGNLALDSWQHEELRRHGMIPADEAIVPAPERVRVR